MAAELSEESGVEHVVLLKIKDGTTANQIEKFREGITSLHTIPGVISITVGETFLEEWMGADRRAGYTHAFRVRLDSKESLKVYQNHERHVKFKAECVAPIVEGSLAVDWESPLKLGSAK